MRFTKALGAAAALCLLLAACTPKAMETFSAWEPEILLYPGDTWEGEIPGDGEEAAYTISVNTVPGLEARLEGGKLILSATQPGGGQLTLAATAKGYLDTNLTLPVRVEANTLELDWTVSAPEETEEGEEPDFWQEGETVGVLAERSAVLTFTERYGDSQTPTDAVLSAELDPPELGEVELGEGKLVFDAGKEYGDGTLTVIAEKAGFDTQILHIPLYVVRGQLPLRPTTGGEEIEAVELENGSSTTVKIETGAGAELTAQLDCDAAVMTRNGNAFAIVGNSLGEGTLTITAEGEGWLGRAITLPVRVTRTKAAITPAASEIAVAPGETEEMSFTTKPKGAAVRATVSGSGFTAKVSGETVHITAAEDAEGSAQITLSVSAPDYEDSSATITAKAQLEPIQLTLSEEAVTLEEGESGTVTATATPEGCTITAEATSGITVEVDGDTVTITPEKSGTVTITASRANRDPVSATVKVTATPPIVLPDVDTETYAKDAAEIIRLTNEYRKANGLSALAHVELLDIPATLRAEEAGEVWSHTRPDGTNFHTVFAQCGLKYTAYGENLFAVNAEYTPAQVLEEWQDSPAHNENLLRENFNGIGVGVAKVKGEYYYCQLFVQR
ncbi:MAG: hypothetical protein HFF13_05135 [Angelakisella sp.]|nr:hypothetical protein [Angelakisella sp.]